MGSVRVWVVGVVWVVMVGRVAEGSWCIARSGANVGQLQTGLDYACGAGADCTPIQPSGLCYLPNTLPAHASYAFNSYYQRSNAAPGSCNFSGAASVSVTDPSYGSCTYPSSSSTAGGSVTGTPNTPGTSTSGNTTNTTPTFGGTTGGLTPGVGGLTPGFGTPTLPNVDTSSASAVHVFVISILVCSLPLLF